MLFDLFLCGFFGGLFKEYSFRILGLDGSENYSESDLDENDEYICVLCFCKHNIRCAELLCYFTTYQSTHRALGFHCNTHPDHTQRGLNSALLHIAICLLPLFKRRAKRCHMLENTPCIIGCQSINPIVSHTMQAYLGCTIKHEDTYLLNIGHIRKNYGVDAVHPHEYDEDTVYKLDSAIRSIFNSNGFLSRIPKLSTKSVHACKQKIMVNRLLREQFQKHCMEYEKQFGKDNYIQIMRHSKSIKTFNRSLCTVCAFNIAGHENHVTHFVQKNILRPLCWSNYWRYVLSLCPKRIIVQMLQICIQHEFFEDYKAVSFA